MTRGTGGVPREHREMRYPLVRRMDGKHTPGYQLPNHCSPLKLKWIIKFLLGTKAYGEVYR